MNPLVELIAKRRAGHVRVSFVSYYGEPISELIAKFGLGCDEFPDPQLREVKRSEARRIIALMLGADMAYRVGLMPAEEAEEMAESFLENFPSEHSRFITNIQVLEDDLSNIGSSPMTRSTFDAGVLCVAEPVAGCIWFEDED
jgi:hypothetical protein